jgi:hypothetical protein
MAAEMQAAAWGATGLRAAEVMRAAEMAAAAARGAEEE